MATYTITEGGYYPTSSEGAERYFAIVHRNFNPFLIEQAFRKKPIFLSLVLRDLANPRGGGFNPIVQPVYFEDWGANVNKLSWTAGFEASPIKNPTVVAQWNMAGYVVAIDTLLPEWSMMQGAGSEYAVIDTIKARFTDFYMELIDTIDTKILGYASSSDEMNGLQDAIDDGTTVATYGGLSRSTYSNWAAPKYDASSVSFSNAWQYVIYYLDKYKANIPGDVPNIVLCSYGVFHKIATSLTSMERIVTATPDEVDLTRGIGIQVLNIGGTYIIPLQKITDDTAYFCNFKYWEMAVNPDLFFALTDTVSLIPVNVLGWRTAILFAGNLVCYRPRYNFKVVNMPSESL